MSNKVDQISLSFDFNGLTLQRKLVKSKQVVDQWWGFVKIRRIIVSWRDTTSNELESYVVSCHGLRHITANDMFEGYIEGRQRTSK